jgi:hypothetical protein
MQRAKLTILFAALALSGAVTAGAQSVVVTEPPAVSDGQVVIITPAPQPVPDPGAATKCQNVGPASYWDCVNNQHGGQ